MMRRKNLKGPVINLSFIFLLCSFGAIAQKDTIRVMQYNLLNYGDADNPTSYKDPRLKTIIDFVKPDIFGCNEIANSPSHSQNILNNVLGAQWEKGTFVNTGNEIQTNTLFWRADKFGLAKQTTISHILRDIIAFKLYYKDANLAQTHDTVFFTIIVAHLKAGEEKSDSSQRDRETYTVATYLNNMGPGNYAFMGDFNLYTATEKAYTNVVDNPNADARLYDPVNRRGKWGGNRDFADVHTQSTRTSSRPDGGATGGLDDRFDHMLVSNSVMQGLARIKYLEGTYHTVGNDGKHFNKSITSTPTNPDVTADVTLALYEMSDHMPIAADYVVTGTPATAVASVPPLDNLINVATLFRDKIEVMVNEKLVGQSLKFDLFSVDGRKVYSANISANARLLSFGVNTGNAAGAAMYILQITDVAGHTTVKKLIKY